jgi:dihydrofolate synthase/folylpolyglutamate synthase
MRSAAETWLASLEKFGMKLGLERMDALLARLGNPQRAFRAIHVVGTNGKSTTARMIEALLTADGLAVGTYTSPHVTAWAERIRVGREEADFEAAIGRVRADAEALGATQFEVLTAAALTAFTDAGVDVAVVEAGLGGRYDATNVLGAPVVALTNVALDHVEQLGPTREAIAAEKLAVVRPGATVVLGEPEWEAPARAAGARDVVVASGGNLAVATAAAEAFLGRDVDPEPACAVRLPGRFEIRGSDPVEVWDGAHNPAGVRHLLGQLDREVVVVASILADKDVVEMLALLARAGRRLVATTSSNPRALEASELARLAEPFFGQVDAVRDPAAAVALARDIAGPAGTVLVTGSLYLLADLSVRFDHVRCPSPVRA